MAEYDVDDRTPEQMRKNQAKYIKERSGYLIFMLGRIDQKARDNKWQEVYNGLDDFIQAAENLSETVDKNLNEGPEVIAFYANQAKEKLDKIKMQVTELELMADNYRWGYIVQACDNILSRQVSDLSSFILSTLR